MSEFGFRELYFCPVSIFPMKAVYKGLSGVSLQIGIYNGEVSVVATIAIRGVGNVSFVGVVLRNVDARCANGAQVGANSRGDDRSYFLGFLVVDPLPKVVRVYDGTFFFASLFVSYAPYKVFYVLYFVVNDVGVVHANFRAYVRSNGVLV